jgi:NADH-quinone oxidoreductase subunit L
LKLEVGGLILLVLGSVTMLIGALCALGERDLKKVVAFSTLSQLGLLIMAIASFSFQTGFFHLIVHAFFKSILFIRIGYSILVSSHNQQGVSIGTRSLRILFLA